MLIALNGAAAVAVLHFTSTIIQKPELQGLVNIAAISIVLFIFGLVFSAHLAAIHRDASLHTDLAHQAEDDEDVEIERVERHRYLAREWSRRAEWFRCLAIGAFAGGASFIPLWILISSFGHYPT